MMAIERRPFLAALLGTALLPVLPTGAVLADEPVKGGTLVAVINPEPSVLTSVVSNHYSVNVVSPNVYDGLLAYDEGMAPLPSLATSWETSADNLSITFRLRPNVTWHDGTPFTAKDIRFSVLELWKKLHPRGRATFAQVTEVETPDDLTAIFKLAQPSPIILSALSAAESQVLPAHLYEGSEVAKNPYNIKPVGTGPFRFVAWQKGEFIEFERNPDYWDAGKPYLDRLIFRVIPDAASRAAAFETGEVQYGPFDPVPLADVARLEDDPSLAITTDGYEWLSPFFTLEFNTQDPIVGNLQVRRAIAQAIDRQGLIDAAWYGFGTVAVSPVPHYQKFFTDDVPQYNFDPKAAEQLLDEAGFPRKEDGTRFAISFDYENNNDNLQNTAEFLRQNLKVVGIDLKLRSQDVPTIYKRVYTDYDFQTRAGQFSAMIDPAMGLYRLYWTKSINKGVPNTNGARYSNPKLDRLIELTQSEPDPAKRLEAFHAWQKIAMTDVPNLPLFELERLTVYNKRLHGLRATPDQAFSSLKSVWLEA
ncbi:MAG: ABC transporter substrate-binding protein [Geminicoccaceae bacterium]